VIRAGASTWTRALYDAYATADGIPYLSTTHAGALAVAVNERATDALPEAPTFNRLSADPALTDILDDSTHRLAYLKQQGPIAANQSRIAARPRAHNAMRTLRHRLP